MADATATAISVTNGSGSPPGFKKPAHTVSRPNPSTRKNAEKAQDEQKRAAAVDLLARVEIDRDDRRWALLLRSGVRRRWWSVRRTHYFCSDRSTRGVPRSSSAAVKYSAGLKPKKFAMMLAGNTCSRVFSCITISL